jgi:AcrR family transcriptional regulator
LSRSLASSPNHDVAEVNRKVPYTAGHDPRRHDDAARERIVATAYELFCHHGVRAIGIDRIVAEAPVAKMTLYKHFRSKGDLVLAVIERREELWTHEWLQKELDRRGGSPRERLLAIFDLFDDWFGGDDYEGCFFINTLVESHRTDGIGGACIDKLANVRSFVGTLTEEAGVREPEVVAAEWFILMCGSIIAAFQRDLPAAKHAREVASALLDREERTG